MSNVTKNHQIKEELSHAPQQLNIDHLRHNLGHQLALLSLIEKATIKKSMIASGNELHYKIFGTLEEKQADLVRINKVIQRLNSYYVAINQKGALGCN